MSIVPAMMKKTTRNYVWVLVANALLLAAVSAMFQFRMNHVPPAQKPLPDALYLAGLTTPTHISDLKGQWTLLNLWASWCAPCIKEMPGLEKISNDNKYKNLRVIAISLDEAKNVSEVDAIIARHHFGAITRNWDFKQDVYRNLNPAGLPTTYLIDPAGNVVLKLEGEHDWTSPETDAMLGAHLQ